MTESHNQPEQNSQATSSVSDTPVQNPSTIAPNPAPETVSTPIVIEQKSSGKGLATGALVLAILALGASGALFVQGQNALNNQQLRFERDLDEAALGNSKNAILLQNTLQKQQEIDAQLDKILKNDVANAETLGGVQRAYSELLKGRVNWLVDEVEVTLNVASQQLLLSGNIPVATAVLENVEARLNRFEQPELLPIKQAISQDLATLKNRPYLNVSATVLRLDRLENAVAGLPLLVDGTLTETATDSTPVSQAGSFWTRAWDNTASLLKGMVEVRKLDNNDAMLIAPEQVYFVRENLRLRLLDARLALLQHNGEVFQNDLNAIEAAIRQYFDVQSPNAQAWLKELGELKALEIRMVSDDALKTSLAAVRDYQNSTRTALPVIITENVSATSASSTTAVTPSSPITSSSSNNVSASVPHETASAPNEAASAASAPQSASEPKMNKGTQS